MNDERNTLKDWAGNGCLLLIVVVTAAILITIFR